MSDTEFDVVIAAYLIPDLAQKDFDGLVKLVADKQLEVEGVALVAEDADGNTTVKETGDHLGRKGLEIGGGLGLVVGLFSPPLLASMVVGGAVGGLAGKFAKHKVESGLEEKLGAALPPGSRDRRHRARRSAERGGSRRAGEWSPRKPCRDHLACSCAFSVDRPTNFRRLLRPSKS